MFLLSDLDGSLTFTSRVWTMYVFQNISNDLYIYIFRLTYHHCGKDVVSLVKSLIFFPPTETTGTGAIWRGKRKFRGTGPSESVGTDLPSQTPMSEYASRKPRWPTNLFDLLNLNLFWILLNYIVRHEAIQFCKQVVLGFIVVYCFSCYCFNMHVFHSFF